MKPESRTRPKLENNLKSSAAERERVKDALRESEDRYRDLVEHSRDLICTHDLDGIILSVNATAIRLMGYDPTDFIGKRSIRDTLAPEVRHLFDDYLARIKRDGFATGLMMVRTRSGEKRIWEYHNTLRTEGVASPIVRGMAHDITERMRAERELQKSQARLELLNTIATQAISGVPIEQLIRHTVERLGERFTKIRVSYSIVDGRGMLTVVHCAHLPGMPPIHGTVSDLSKAPGYLGALRTREPVVVEDVAQDPRAGPLAGLAIIRGIGALLHMAMQHSDGASGLLCFDSPEARKWSDHEIATLRETAEYLSIALRQAHAEQERERAKESLAAEKERLAVTLRSIGDATIATDRKGGIVLMNRVAEKLTGWTQDEALGKPLNDVFRLFREKTRERCYSAVEAVLNTGEAVSFSDNAYLIANDGTERIIGDSATPIRDRNGEIIGVVLVFRDNTEQRKVHEEIIKSSKLESLGVLAGGIAHEFNNILTTIMGNISLALTYPGTDQLLRERLVEAESVCLRAKDLTRKLLTFSKGGAPVKRTVSTARFLKDAACLSSKNSAVRCEFDLASDLWPVEIDEGQMGQVVHNLVCNAQEAMPEGGNLRIQAENFMLEKAKPGLHLPRGAYVKIAINDAGIGIPGENLSKIFDPFFTTKAGASGLGLSSAYSIIKGHDGYTSVESSPGAGTSVYIYLPASAEEIETRRKIEIEPRMGRGRVLVMDDEDTIRELCGTVMNYFGYEAALARDGAEAIELYKQAAAAGEPFDVVMLDIHVPGGMGGKETIKKLREIAPDVKAIVSSGYSDDPVMARFREHGFSGFVAKPYDINDLAQVLSDVLAGKNKPS